MCNKCNLEMNGVDGVLFDLDLRGTDRFRDGNRLDFEGFST